MEGRRWNWRSKEDGMRSQGFWRDSMKQVWRDRAQGIYTWSGNRQENGRDLQVSKKGSPSGPCNGSQESCGSPSFKHLAPCRRWWPLALEAASLHKSWDGQRAPSPTAPCGFSTVPHDGTSEFLPIILKLKLHKEKPVMLLWLQNSSTLHIRYC